MTQFSQAEISNLMTELSSHNHSNPITAANLATAVGLSPAPNQEELRELIRQAINSGNFIGSNNKGYFIIKTVAELDDVLNSLQRRAQGNCDRRNELLSSWNATNKNKSTLVLMDVKP